jgi:hypothetical protein
MRSMGIVVAGIVVGLLLAGGPAGNAIGQTTYNWTNTGTSSWFTPANWSPSGPPAAGHRARINSGGTAQIAGATANVGYNNEEGSLQIDSWEDGGAGGNLEVNAGGILDMNGAGLYVGAGYRDLTEGTLTINGGTITNLGTRYIEIPRQGRGVMTINSGSVYYSGGIYMSHYGLDDEVNWPAASLCYGKFYMNGGQLVRTGASGDFIVGNVGTGTVIMAGGLIDDNVNGVYARTLSVGSGSGVGEFLQSGGTSRWNVVVINQGTLTVTNNARLEMGRGSTAHNKNIYMFNGSALNVQAGGEIVGLGTSGQRWIVAADDPGATGVVTMTGGRIDFTDAHGDSGVYLGTDVYGLANGAGVGIFNMSGGFGVLRNLNVGYSTGGEGIATLSGGTLSNTVLRIGGKENTAATASSTGTVTVSGTHVLIPNGVTVGVYDNCQGTLNMSGGTVSNASQGITFASGSGTRAYGTLTGGVMNVSGLTMGVGANSRAEVSMGGTFALRSAGSVTIGYSGAGSYAQLSISNDAAVTIDGDNLHLGANSGGTGIVNMAGGTVTLTQTAAGRGLEIGRGGPGWLNLSGGSFECQEIYYRRYNGGAGPAHINVSGDGILTARGVVRVQGVDPGSTLVATSGGVVDFGTTSSLTVNSDNSVTNAGGVFQFRSANPTITITPDVFGAIVFDGGTVSFRGINNADVRCNQGGYPLDSATKVSWAGANGFRLNAATNINNANQAYMFTDTLGSTNFARLDLLNGSLYRGGNVTIGSGGTLTVTGAASTIADDLTLESGSTYSVMLDAGGTMSHVAVNGAVTLGGTLAIELASAPQQDYPYLVMDNNGTVAGAFASSIVYASYDGQTYDFSVRRDGNDVVVGWYAKGTVITVK